MAAGGVSTNRPFLLEARDIVKDYATESGVVKVLRGVSYAVCESDFVAIMGPSGSGKTTFLSLLGGLEQPTSGEIILRGRDLGRLSGFQLAELRRFEVGFIFQQFYLVEHLTALENVEFPLNFQGSLTPAERRRRAVELLELVDLKHRTTHFPRHLSGGEQQRVAIARAIANEPALLLADEPTGNLDASSSEKVLDIFASLNERLGQTIIIVTHDPLVAERASRTVYMDEGRLHELT